MPWSPSGDVEASNPALDPFRDRAGMLRDDGDGELGYVFLRAQTHWSRSSGHLWWSQWASPREGVRAHLRRGDGRVTAWLVSDEDLESQLSQWQQGVFRHGTATHHVVWLNDAESARVSTEIFGLD